MKNLIVLLMLFFLLMGCVPSEKSIQEAISQTQTAMPTSTATPEPTINSCTDLGWSDITTYLKQFDSSYEPVAGTSINGHIDKLENIKSKINDVKIDVCSENARQTIIEGLANKIQGMLIAITGGTQSDAVTAMSAGIRILNNGVSEVKSLGIILDYP